MHVDTEQTGTQQGEQAGEAHREFSGWHCGRMLAGFANVCN
jgi:hypothetical protein